jgi:hypothetical protein
MLAKDARFLYNKLLVFAVPGKYPVTLGLPRIVISNWKTTDWGAVYNEGF